MRNIVLKIMGAILGLLGLLTLFISSSLLFDLFGIRARLNHYVLFIVYANFISAFSYLFASYCFFTNKKEATVALFIGAAVLLAAYISLLIYIQTGRVFEIRTVKVMLIRTSVTIIFAGISWYFFTRTRLTKSQDLN